MNLYILHRVSYLSHNLLNVVASISTVSTFCLLQRYVKCLGYYRESRSDLRAVI